MRKTDLLPFLLILFGLIFSTSSLFADIANPDRFGQKIKFTNLDEFPEYQFYFMYKNYTYNRGYGVSSETQVFLENDQEYETSNRYGSVKIYAFLKKKKKKKKFYFHTEESIGGDKSFKGLDTELVATYQVEALEAGTIKLKRVTVDPEGNTGTQAQPYKGSSPTTSVGPGSWYYWLLPSLCLSALAGFFLFRHRQKLTLKGNPSSRPRA